MNKKGVSMISLVIVIIVTIILIGIAVTAGYRYIEEGNKLKAQILGETIGNSAHRRQTDVNSGTASSFYEGYYVNREELIKPEIHKAFEGLPTTDSNGNNIYDVIESTDGMWYVIDAESATSLGSDGSENLLTRNISYALNQADSTESLKVILVDYMSGNGYYVVVPANILKQATKHNGSGVCPLSPDGKHKFTIATCTEDSECIYGCGTEDGPKALGHKWVAPTCTAAGYCERCNITDPDHSEPLGHIFITNAQVDDADLVATMSARECIMVEDLLSNEAWITNAEKHWHECYRCGIKKNEEGHNLLHEKDGKLFSFIPEPGLSEADKYHHQECLTCGWHSIKSKHEFEITLINDNHHKAICKLCDYSVNHIDSGWQKDHPTVHYRYCETDDSCNHINLVVNGVDRKVLATEPHRDEDHDYFCDVCGRELDTTPPLNFNIEEGDITTFFRVKEVDGKKQITSSTITVEAFTIDKETKVDHYQFGVRVNGVIQWFENLVHVSSEDEIATYTFSNFGPDKPFKPNESYDLCVRAFDSSGNSNSPEIITEKTTGFPKFKDLKNVPDPYIKGTPGADIGVEDIECDDPQIKISYRQNGGSWSNPVTLDHVKDISIRIREEEEILEFKFVDSNGNESKSGDIVTRTLKVIDNTPPIVNIVFKDGDSGDIPAMTHTAVVTLYDKLSGIAPNTVVTYGWSTSLDTPPETIKTHLTNNTSNISDKDYTFDVATPPGVQGTYYLWVFSGVKDAVGNETTEIKKKAFEVDDVRPEVTNIKMFNANPVVDGEDLFVKTNGTVTVTFTVDKELRYNPKVRINNQDATEISHTGYNYTAIIPIDESFQEGELQLFLGEVMAKNGRLSMRSYNNDDLVKGPVIYDRTPPEIEYIPKKG